MSFAISYDENLIQELSTRFDLRRPNREALTALVKRLDSGNYSSLDILMLDLATGVGKTYVLAAFIEYLNRQHARNVMVVTPGKVVQDKTVADLSAGSDRYIAGFAEPPILVTPDNPQSFSIANSSPGLLLNEDTSMVFIFNVQQLFPPKEGGKNVASGQEAVRRKTWRWQEEYGSLMEYLRGLDDLVVIVDEAHLFGSTAKVYRSALEELQPQVTVGLTASPDKDDDIVYRYPLWRAIRDGHVKQPVLVYRSSGYDSEERQLQDAMSLLAMKEEAYANWCATHPRGKQTKPLLFVVCPDVSNASRIAERLRSTAFAGNDLAVLQVDNQHDDVQTQTLLRELDKKHSPVRIIVSVNKLREGWDTKRIAVMCTLRAMGSEVLTQQVMGRGIRLPFGTLTGEAAIDELDIISHKSFVSLLKSENILKEFGIDSKENTTASDVLVKPGEKHTPKNQPSATGHDSVLSSDPATASAASSDGVREDSENSADQESSLAGVLGSRGLRDDEEIAPHTETFTKVKVTVNEKFRGTTFLFPSTTMDKTTEPFELSDISNENVIAAAKRTMNTSEYLERTRVEVIEDEKGSIGIRGEDLDRVAVESFHQTERVVANELSRRVLTTGGVSSTQENITQLSRRIVPLFMSNAGITQWTEKAKFSAAEELRMLVQGEIKKAISQTRTKTRVRPLRLPINESFELKVGAKVLERLAVEPNSTKASTGFKEREFYGPWTKGLFDAASFDSFSGEYKLAHVLNFDPDVVWWKRLYRSEHAVVAYSQKEDYYPDFVALATDGTHWIIEGKSQKGQDEELVQVKRAAAEKAIRLLASHPDYLNQSWGYLIAYEQDIAKSRSLADLIAISATEKTVPIADQ